MKYNCDCCFLDSAVIIENTTTALIFHRSRVDYEGASTLCRSNGSVLVNIRTASIQEAIFLQLFRQPSFDRVTRKVGFWVGGKRLENNETWYWNDGTAIPRFNQSALNYSQPGAFSRDTNTSVSRCLWAAPRDITAVVDTSGAWKISPCSEKNFYICEKHLSKRKPTVIVSCK